MQLIDNEDGSVYAERAQYLVYPKDLKLKTVDLQPVVEVNWGIGAISFTSPTLVKDVFITLPEGCSELSENFFDIEPNKLKCVTFKVDGWTKENKIVPEVKVMTLNNIEE